MGEPEPITVEIPQAAAPDRPGLLGMPLGTLFVEAHSGLSAIIAERSGFRGLWASSFSISTAKGKRDCGELSLTELASSVAEMADVTDLPILVDADTGFGDYNNCRISARQLRRAGACGMVIEDKMFPKANSFLDVGHTLIGIPEFRAKIQATKDAMGPDFKVIARTEVFIAGGSLEEALCRADSYAQAGADGIFVHSKLPMAREIGPFIAAWRTPLPLVLAPTMYGDIPFAAFERLGVALVLCANHNMRASALAMLDLCAALRRAPSLAEVEERLVPISDIFELLGYDELDQARARFQPALVS